MSGIRQKRITVKKGAKSKKMAATAKKGAQGRSVGSRAARKNAKASAARKLAKAVAAELVAMPVAVEQTVAAPVAVIVPTSVIIDGKQYQSVAKSLDALCADPTILEPPDMVIPFFAPANRITLLVGREKTGKSTIAAHICSVASRGGVLMGMTILPMQVLWIGLEEFEGDTARRFAAMKANGVNLHLVRSLGANAFAQLKAEIELGAPRLVVIDSLSRYASELLDENNASAVNALLSPLVDLVHNCGAAVVMLHHATKKANGEYRGSGAIGAQVDQIIVMTEDLKDSKQRNFRARGRITVPDFAMRYNPVSASYEYLGEAPKQAEVKAQVQVDLAHRVIEHVRQNPGLGSNAIRAALGGRGVEIDAVLKSLVVAETLKHNGRRGGYQVAAAA